MSFSFNASRGVGWGVSSEATREELRGCEAETAGRETPPARKACVFSFSDATSIVLHCIHQRVMRNRVTELRSNNAVAAFSFCFFRVIFPALNTTSFLPLTAEGSSSTHTRVSWRCSTRLPSRPPHSPELILSQHFSPSQHFLNTFPGFIREGLDPGIIAKEPKLSQGSHSSPVSGRSPASTTHRRLCLTQRA